jgi:uncharacterized protein
MVLKVLLLLLALGVLGLLLNPRRRRSTGRSQAERSRRADASGATLLACAHCGVHLPQSEALIDASGRPYCSDAHRLAGPGRPD